MSADYIKQLKLSKDNREYKTYCFNVLSRANYFRSHSRFNLERELQCRFKQAYDAEPKEQKKINTAFQSVNSYLRSICKPHGFKGMIDHKEKQKSRR